MARERPRLSVTECRRLLGPSGAGLSDLAVLRLRDQLYTVGEIVVSLVPDRSVREATEDIKQSA